MLIHALPIFHVHGLFVASHGALLNGSKMIWFSKFDPKAVLARFADATVFMGVPTLYVRLLGEAGADARGLREHAPVRRRLGAAAARDLRRWRERTGHTIVERYGMSETVMLTSNPYHAEDGERARRHRRLSAARRRRCACATSSGNDCPTGEIGGIEVNGPNVFKGYWRMPEKTAEEFTADGWFKTGDVGRFDADGYLTIVGRSKDLIISGGYNVYPAEIEGVPERDGRRGRIGGDRRAAPRLRRRRGRGGGGAGRSDARRRGDDRRAEDEDRQLQGAEAAVRRAELPRNAMGKVQKNLLRERHGGLFDGAAAGPCSGCIETRRGLKRPLPRAYRSGRRSTGGRRCAPPAGGVVMRLRTAILVAAVLAARYLRRQRAALHHHAGRRRGGAAGRLDRHRHCERRLRHPPRTR